MRELGVGEIIHQVPERPFLIDRDLLRFRLTGASFSANQAPFVRYFTSGEEDFKRFYELHQPSSIYEAHFLEPSDQPLFKDDDLALIRLPWRPRRNFWDVEKGLSPEYGHWGPLEEENLRSEVTRLSAIGRSIAEHGYQPAEFDGHISGYFLRDNTSPSPTVRFLVKSGQHRAAYLAYSGWAEIPVVFVKNYPRVVNLSDLKEWPGVMDGTFTEKQARRIFNAYFRPEGDQLLKGWAFH